MQWFRKHLLWAAVGLLGPTAAAPAQSSGIILTRPNPVTAWPASAALPAPPVTLARPVPLPEAGPAPAAALPPVTGVQQVTHTTPANPGYTVRAQMDQSAERLLPAVANLLGNGSIAALVQSPGEANPPAGPSPTPKAAQESSDDSKKFIPPQPRTFPVDGIPGSAKGDQIIVSDGPIIIYEGDPSALFGSPGTASRFYARGEYLLWWTKGYPVPILVTTAPATNPEATLGTLGVNGTVPLYGGSNVHFNPGSGYRLTAGWFFDPCGMCGIEGSFFSLPRRNSDFSANSNQFPVLARPFFNVNIGAPDRELTTTPGIGPGSFFNLVGGIDVHNYTELWGTQLNVRRLLCCGCDYSISAIAGFRYLDLREGLDIHEFATSLKAVPGIPAFDPGNQLSLTDSFHTHNRFYGGQVGLDGDLRRGRWTFGGKAQVALGVTSQTIDIAGSQTVVTPAGQVTTVPGGLLALASNSGHFHRDRFGVVPEVGLRVGYYITPNVRVFVGYDFLYWSNVVRPGDQVDTSVNVTQIPNFGSAPAFAPPSNLVRPIVPFRATGFWAQGINAGIEVRY